MRAWLTFLLSAFCFLLCGRAQFVIDPYTPFPAAGGGGACDTVSWANTNRSSYSLVTAVQIGVDATNKYIMSVFTASNSVSVCAVKAYAQRASLLSETNTTWAALYTYSSGIGTLIDQSDNVTWSSTTTEYYTYPNLNATLTSGTQYCLVFGIDRMSLWHSYVRFGHVVSESGSGVIQRSSDLSTWYDVSQSNSELMFVFMQ